MEHAIQLSSDELAALERGEPLHLQDSSAHQLVLVLAEQYERLRQFVEVAETDPKSVYPIIADVFPEDWEDLSAYPNAEKL